MITELKLLLKLHNKYDLIKNDVKQITKSVN